MRKIQEKNIVFHLAQHKTIYKDIYKDGLRLPKAMYPNHYVLLNWDKLTVEWKVSSPQFTLINELEALKSLIAYNCSETKDSHSKSHKMHLMNSKIKTMYSSFKQHESQVQQVLSSGKAV